MRYFIFFISSIIYLFKEFLKRCLILLYVNIIKNTNLYIVTHIKYIIKKKVKNIHISFRQAFLQIKKTQKLI